MEKSKVYFTDMRCTFGTSLLKKLDTLLVKAGIEGIDFEGKFVAIKIHFGEPGNLAYLRPGFAKVVADKVTALGGKPFLTDCNTLYVGRRKDALEHLQAAQENGFCPTTTGCQIIIADGLKGTDDVEVAVPGGQYCKTARIGRAVMDADIVLSLNHFKGHESAGFGGAIKNLGMGCGSRAGKMQMHSEGKPKISATRCRACGACFLHCAQGALHYGESGKAQIDAGKCVGCGRCIGACNFAAIYSAFEGDNHSLNCKMAEYTKAILHGRPHFHINIVNQVSPYCDCHGENDAAVVPDIGMFASFNPVALDAACIDAVNAAPTIKTSMAGEKMPACGGCGANSSGQAGASPQNGCALCAESAQDHFAAIHPGTNWRSQIQHAQDIGLGSGQYTLVNI